MTLYRLITWMSGIPECAVRGLAPVERLRLAHECRRLLRAAEPPAEPQAALPTTPAFRATSGAAEISRTIAAARETAEPPGILARLRNGERAP
jgi:hypothetical protein